jgi:hypothetical protein
MYHLYKQSRTYKGIPYCGLISRGVPAEYETLSEARYMRDKFHKRNPVGWDIYDGITKELIEGFSFSINLP